MHDGKRVWWHLRLSEAQRLERHILNGSRVQMARESRGMERHTLARKLGITTALLARRESGWDFWDDVEVWGLAFFTHYQPMFFVEEDAPDPMAGTLTFMCGHTPEGECVCQVILDDTPKGA